MADYWAVPLLDLPVGTSLLQLLKQQGRYVPHTLPGSKLEAEGAEEELERWNDVPENVLHRNQPQWYA